MLFLLSWTALAIPSVCLQKGKAITFVFQSSADYDNRIELIEQGSGTLLHSFHNKYEDLDNRVYGIGTHRYVPDRDLCIEVYSHHRTNGPWIANRAQHSCKKARFEDSGDDDFNDGMLEIEGYTFFDCPKNKGEKLQT